MAFSRLFGKGKREVPSPTEQLETTEKDDTVVVTKTNSIYPSVRAAPAVPAVESLPYQLPGRAADQFQTMSITTQDSNTWQPLQGIKFTLNSRYVVQRDFVPKMHNFLPICNLG